MIKKIPIFDKRNIEDEKIINLNTQSHHQLFCDYANKSLVNYRNQMKDQMLKNNKHPLEYSINDYVCLAIPRIDRNSIDRCKKYSDQTYKLQCKNGILDISFIANELMPLGPNEYRKLENCQSDIISVREAARMQSTSAITRVQSNCKGKCKKCL
ncbi:hypothetical protein RhiirA1_467395 [Rhizophagus irregularis]|uniref:Uncharacterized protein n=1 Tax=Rhizophagus irregularis TaxID=588596 RepID=A0A2N0RC52_9GLOM|nr:hypothetical protein RhiirA1_467395 [Rhizophagus irregularis]